MRAPTSMDQSRGNDNFRALLRPPSCNCAERLRMEMLKIASSWGETTSPDMVNPVPTVPLQNPKSRSKFLFSEVVGYSPRLWILRIDLPQLPPSGQLLPEVKQCSSRQRGAIEWLHTKGAQQKNRLTGMSARAAQERVWGQVEENSSITNQPFGYPCCTPTPFAEKIPRGDEVGLQGTREMCRPARAEISPRDDQPFCLRLHRLPVVTMRDL